MHDSLAGTLPKCVVKIAGVMLVQEITSERLATILVYSLQNLKTRKFVIILLLGRA